MPHAAGGQSMNATAPVVFLIDVDNTLLDNDAVLKDLRHQVQHELGLACWERYRAILVELWDELGYRDYLGALQRFRVEHPHDARLPRLSLLLMDYSFGSRLYPCALDVVARLRGWAPTVIVTDGDVVFQPRKIQQSGLWRAVDGHVLIYTHKERELHDIETRYPADQYVLIDDKLTILTPVKRAWGSRVITVFPRQGQYAHDPKLLASHPPPDITIARIADLLKYDLPTLLAADSGRHPPRQNVFPIQAKARRSVATPSRSRSQRP
jgi:FMN phosphatase YigB (HAD superfamily)